MRASFPYLLVMLSCPVAAALGCGAMDDGASRGVVVAVEVFGAGSVLWSVDGEAQDPCVHEANDVVSDTLCLDPVFESAPAVKLQAGPDQGFTFAGFEYAPLDGKPSSAGGCGGSASTCQWRPGPDSGACIARFQPVTP